MTTNYERAIGILNKHWGVAKETGMADETECCVEALDEAGLLAPDLPEDKFGVWRVSDTCGTYSSPAPDDVDNVWSYRGRVFFEPNWESEYANQSYVGNYTPHKARKVALALLAAANHLEREQS